MSVYFVYTIGTCSLCGGRVTSPRAWYSTTDPIPTCENCGATKKFAYGPVINMEKPTKETGSR